ncbi:MAG: fatty acid desaturase [Chitinophagales bacterium]|nr:fatty acid desaturase [Chitinophagales bacterium]
MQLRYKADRRSVFVVVLYFIVAGFSYVYFPQEWYLIIPIIVINSLLSFTCAIIIHNTVHAPIFVSKRWNKFFQIVLSFTYGHSVSAYVSGHNFSHHKYTQSAKDSIRTSKMRFKWNFLNQLLFFFVVAPAVVRDENAFAKLMYKEKPSWFCQYALEMALVVSVKLALIILHPLAGICVFVLPHLYAVWGILGTNYWQHDGCDQEHPYNHTRNFTHPFLNYIAFNNGFHSAHHDKPNLHWSLLPAYHEKNIVPYIHPNLNRNSLVQYLWETHIYPGVRTDYLGNKINVPKKSTDESWVLALQVKEHITDLGVEG